MPHHIFSNFRSWFWAYIFRTASWTGSIFCHQHLNILTLVLSYHQSCLCRNKVQRPCSEISSSKVSQFIDVSWSMEILSASAHRQDNRHPYLAYRILQDCPVLFVYVQHVFFFSKWNPHNQKKCSQHPPRNKQAWDTRKRVSLIFFGRNASRYELIDIIFLSAINCHVHYQHLRG